MLELDDIAEVMATIAREIAAAYEKRVDALQQRIEELEQRQLTPGTAGRDGKDGTDGADGVGIADVLIDADGGLVLTLTDGNTKALGRVVGKNGIDGADGKDGQDGRDGNDAELSPPAQVDMDAVGELITRTVTALLAELPAAVPGERGEPGAKGDDGVGLSDAALDPNGNLRLTLTDGSTKMLGPVVGKDGADGKNGQDGQDGKPGRDGVDGAAGKDGTGLADAILDREGNLVLTMTNGATKSLGVVIGKDGANGLDGKDGETFELDDFDIVPLDDERTFKFCFTRGAVAHSFEFAFPVVLDRGVYSAGKQYQHGDAVTWAGSLWIAQRSTDAKPDSPDGGWRLAVKRGRDGKDAK